jgi:hypothetical protein
MSLLREESGSSMTVLFPHWRLADEGVHGQPSSWLAGIQGDFSAIAFLWRLFLLLFPHHQIATCFKSNQR